MYKKFSFVIEARYAMFYTKKNKKIFEYCDMLKERNKN